MKILISSGRFIFRILHVLLRAPVRLLLILVLLNVILLFPYLGLKFTPDVVSWTSDQQVTIPLLDAPVLQSFLDKYKDVILYISSLGLLTALIVFFLKATITSLLEIKNNLVEVLGYNWIPGSQIRESLIETWKQIKDTGLIVRKTLLSSVKVCFSLLMASVIASLIHVVETRETENWEKSVDAELESIKKQQFGWLRIFAQWQENVMPLQKETEDKPTPPGSPINTPVIFSLLYPHGSFKELEGICPENGQFQNLEFLELFRAAINECPENEPPLKLEIKGFSSIAPLAVGDATLDQDLLNCEVANQRAEAVVGFLLSKPEDEYSCRESLDDKRWKNNKNVLCKRKKDEFSFGKEDGLKFDLVYKPWQNYGDLTQSKPVNDGTLKLRKHPAELLNRSVQIIVNNDSCWQSEWKQKTDGINTPTGSQ